MAHILLHYSLGVACVTVPAIPALLRQVRTGRPLARALGLHLVMSHAVGVFAVIPGVLPHLGIPAPWCRGWWMNIFLFHPLLDRIEPGGALVAELTTVALFGLQYAMVLFALAAGELRVKQDYPRAPSV